MCRKINKIFCLGPKIGEGGDDKQVINLIRPSCNPALAVNSPESEGAAQRQGLFTAITLRMRSEGSSDCSWRPDIISSKLSNTHF